MRKENGYTLIELLITVAIVGILASISIPSYNSYVMKSDRTEGKSFILEIMQRQEKFYNENNTYTTTLSDLGYAGATATSEKGHYTVTATAGADGIADNVVLTAEPIGSQARDTECGSFVMNSNGAKSVSTSATTCW